MPLSKNPEERKKELRAVVALSKVPPERRKQVLNDHMQQRGLQTGAKLTK